MNDERVVAAAIHAGLQSDEVTDLYTGDCRGCGECCSRRNNLYLKSIGRCR